LSRIRLPNIRGPFPAQPVSKAFTAVTIARIATLHGLPVGPFSLSTTPVPLRKQRDRHELHPFEQSHKLWLPSAASPRTSSLSSFASTHAPLRNRCVLLGEQADRRGFPIRGKSKPHSSRQVCLPSNTRSLMAEIACCCSRTPGKRHRQPKANALNRRDQRAVCSVPRPVGRPRPPLDHVRSTTQTARSSRVALAELPQRRRLPSAVRQRRCAPAALL